MHYLEKMADQARLKKALKRHEDNYKLLLEEVENLPYGYPKYKYNAKRGAFLARMKMFQKSIDILELEIKILKPKKW